MKENNNIPIGYKDSAVGIIPQEWEVKSLGDLLARLANGLTYDVSITSGYPVSRIETISGGEINYTKVGYIDNVTGCESYRMQKGDILYSHINSLTHVGKVAYYDGKQDLYHGMNLLLLRVNEKVDSNYLYAYLLTSQAKHIAQMIAKPAVNQASISTSDIRKIKLPIPPLAEQKKIAEILGVWDEAIEKQNLLIEKLELRKRALMQRLLTGKTRLPGFTEPWQKVKFKQIFEKKNITFEESNTTLEILSVTKEGVMSQKEYFSKDIASEDISKYKLVERGDLAMSGLNFWMGSCHILTEYDRGLISPAYKVFCVNYNYNLPFIIHFVRGHAFKYSLIGCSVVGASIVRRNLDKEMLNEWIYLIPSLSEQKAIAEVLTTADNEIAIHSKTLDALRLQKRGLMQQLLTGKTRVKI